MPELPEVETIKHQLQKALVGQTITDVQVFKQKSFHGDPSSIIGSQITGTRRFGKVLVLDLSKTTKHSSTEALAKAEKNNKTKSLGQQSDVSSQLSLVVHLKMTGQLIYEPHGVGDKSHLRHRIAGGHPTADFTGQLPSNHTRVIFELKNESDVSSQLSDVAKLYFNDQRIFGWVKVVPTSQVEKLPFIQKLGPELSQISKDQWTKIFRSSKKPVKLRLMDQDKIAGLGNIYANDALWLAKIRPDRPANSLSDKELQELHQASTDILKEGIKYGGATAADGKYIDLQGLGGKYQDHFKTYQRDGQPCLRKDGGTIQKHTLGGRGTFYCPVCQR